MKIAFLMANCLSLALYFGVVLLFLRQLLPFASRRTTKIEEQICRLTEPIFFVGGWLCRMLQLDFVSGIDYRFPLSATTLALAAMAATAGF